MGGSHCCIIGCGANSSRHRGLSFHKIPKKGKSTDTDEWRGKLIAAVSRADKGFNPDKAMICSRHFNEECFEPFGDSKRLKPMSMPTKFMPTKTIPATVLKPRKEPAFRLPPVIPQVVAYYTLEEIKTSAAKITEPMPNWYLNISPDSITFALMENDFIKLRITVSEDLKNQVAIKGKAYTYFTNAVETQGLKVVLHALESIKLCCGVTCDELQQYALIRSSGATNKENYHREVHTLGTGMSASAVFSDNCLLAAKTDAICPECNKVKRLLLKKQERATVVKPIHPFTSFSKLQPQAVLSLLKTARKENAGLKLQLQKKLAEASAAVDNARKELCEARNTQNTFPAVINNENEFIKLFWEEQKKAFNTNKGGMRWHPTMFRFANMLRGLSPSVYSVLRETGVLKLPGESTLRDYTNVFQPKTGFQKQALDDLKAQSEKLPENKRFVALCHDEVQLNADIVFDECGESVIGLIDKEKWTFTEDDIADKVATHVLTFFIVGINSDIKSSVAYFATKGATAEEIYLKFWKTVAFLETQCKLKVIISTSNTAACNLAFCKLHQLENASGVCFKTKNKYAPSRFVYFISDVPHLIKTLRNILEKSRADEPQLWFEDVLLWDHIIDVWKNDHGVELYHSKLTTDHVNLTPKTRMSVNLAAEVMSSSTAQILATYFPPTHKRTAEYVQLVDRFFDCLNCQHLQEGQHESKPDRNAYKSRDDPRFAFLKDEFLGFFQAWKTSVDNRPGPYTDAHKKTMFLSAQTYTGLQMAVHGFIEATKFLLSNGVKLVLSNRLCQIPVEEHFGRHHGICEKADNPSLYAYGYQDERITIQHSQATQFMRKAYTKKCSSPEEEVVVSTSPLKKRKKE